MLYTMTANAACTHRDTARRAARQPQRIAASVQRAERSANAPLFLYVESSVKL